MTALIQTERGLQVRCGVDPIAAADRVWPRATPTPNAERGTSNAEVGRRSGWQPVGSRHVIESLWADGDLIGWISAAPGAGFDSCPRVGDCRHTITHAEARAYLERLAA